jgi:RNA polymerase sigma factor (sigma-70 family)
MLAEAGRPVSVDGPTGGLADVIARLPLSERTVVVLRYWADLDHDSIGRAMGLRPSSVRSLLTRATARLRKEISE